MKTTISLIFLISFSSIMANDFSIATHFGFSLSQQQVKTEIGGANYPKLFNHGEVNFNLTALYYVNDYLAVGGYLRYDSGNRTFSEVLKENQLVVANGKNNDFSELWLGPMVTGKYKSIFLGLGYGLATVRYDDFVSVENEGGNSSPLNATPFAWFVHLGGRFDLTESIDFVVLVEYRVRYYDSIDGEIINHDNKIGMQNITPMFGLEFSL